MARKFLTSIDMGQLEILQLRIQNLSSAPGSPVSGQVYYDTTGNTLYFRGSSTWINTNPASLLALANTWTNSNAFNGAITGNAGINLTGTGASSVGGTFGAVAFGSSGLTGAATATRYAGGTSSGAPASGTFTTGDFIVTTGGDIWICTTGGSPGTWSRVGSYLLGTNNTWTGTNAFNAAITGNNTINLTGTGSSSVGGLFTAAGFANSGLTGATSASRYVGATTSGAPASGTFAVGDFIIDRTGSIWICTSAGSPGTWTQVGATGTLYYQTIKNNAGTGQTQRANLKFLNGTYVTVTVADSSPDTTVAFDIAAGGTPGAMTFNTSASNGSGTTVALANHTHAFPAQSTFALSGFGAPTADVAWGGYKITGLGTPTASTDAATKGYVDSVATGLDVKGSVRMASTANISGTYTATGGTSGRGQLTAMSNAAIDGVSLVAGDRILLKNQSTGAQNGIYVVTTVGTGSNGVWDRATDFDADAEVTSGAFVFVEEGTANADTGWVLTTNNPIIIGGGSGTALVWAQFSGAGTYVAGGGLTLTGTTFDVGAGTGIVVNANDVAVNRTGTNNAHVPLRYTTATHASSTSIAITHNLGQQFVLAQVYEVATSSLVDVDITCTSTTVTTFTFAVAPSANTYRFVIYG